MMKNVIFFFDGFTSVCYIPCRAGNTKSGDRAWMVKKIRKLQKKNIK